MLGCFNSIRQTSVAAVTAAAARSGGQQSNASSSATTTLLRALSTSTESLKVKTTTPPPVPNQEERIKYFKIYRWDPDHRQKPVRFYYYYPLFFRVFSMLSLTYK